MRPQNSVQLTLGEKSTASAGEILWYRQARHIIGKGLSVLSTHSHFEHRERFGTVKIIRNSDSGNCVETKMRIGSRRLQPKEKASNEPLLGFAGILVVLK